jgi:cysteine desulfurase
MSTALVSVARGELRLMANETAIYLDYQASTPLDPRVDALMASVSVASFANPHSDDHADGWAARGLIDHARSQVAGALGAAPEEILFTSGATEADNLGVLGAALGAPPDRKRLLVSAIEHKAVLESAYAAEAYGFQVEIIPVDSDGVVDTAWLAAAIGRDVAVVSVMAVNNEIGTVQPVAAVAAIAGGAGAFMHTDATQAPAAMAVDLAAWDVDAASFSSHKIYGPKGVGALFLSSTAPWRPRPLMFGGGQEQGLRPGTLPTALCAGFGLAMTLFTEEERARVAALRDRLAHLLMSASSGLSVTAEAVDRHPGNLHLLLPHGNAKDLLTRLQPRLSASAGSACSSGMLTESHVLLALGLSQSAASRGLRLALGRFTTDAEVKRSSRLLLEAMATLDN